MINKLSASHSGTQPIRVLQHNILYQFENTTPDFIQRTTDVIITNGLHPGIQYHINELPIQQIVDGHSQTPYVDGFKKIHFHETFASYVWCVAYSMVVLYDEAVAKPQQNRCWGEERNKINNELIERAQALFNYGVSLIVLFTPWNKDDLPNPEAYHEEDDYYIPRINSLCVYAMNYIFCHEFVHVEKGHVDNNSARTTTPGESLLFEKEADRRSIELIMSGVPEARLGSAKAGILIGLCCLLYFDSTTRQDKHPDVDQRIDSYLQFLAAPADDLIWGLASMAYRLWGNQFGRAFEYPRQVNDFKEMYEWFRNQVTEENQIARKRKLS